MDSLKLDELAQLAKQQGIARASKMKRSELIRVLSIKHEPECEGDVCEIVVPPAENKTPAEKKPPAEKKVRKSKEEVYAIIQGYISAVVSIPIPPEVVDKMSKARLIEAADLDGPMSKVTKADLFKAILRNDLEELIM